MSQKNETLPLFLAIIITIGLIFGGIWFLLERWAALTKTTTNATPVTQELATNNCNTELKVPSGTFNYGGSTTWAPLRRDADPELEKICPQFVLRYTQPPAGKPGSGTGIQMLIDNQLAFAQSSRSVKGEENNAARQKGFSLKEIPVAIDGIAVAVNPSLNIRGLTIAQIKDIYISKITNWQEVGGPNLAIAPYSRRPETSGTVEFFVENVLEKGKLGTTVKYIDTTTEAIRALAASGAIYYASAPEIVPQCTIKPLPVGRDSSQLVPPYQEPLASKDECVRGKHSQLNASAFRSSEYPITRNLFVILKQNGQTDQQAGYAYANWLLTPQGQAIVEKAGFVRIK